MAKKIIVSNISWDIEAIGKNLPNMIVIDDPTEDMFGEGGHDEVGDYLTDHYGACVNDFHIDIVD